MASYTVAGVTGHVGSRAAAELLDRGNRIRVIVRDPTRGVDWSRRGAEVAVGSLDDREFLAATIGDTDGFFTLLPGNPMLPDYPDVMLPLGEAIADAVKSSAIRHVVMLSSIGAEIESGTGPIRVLHHFENRLRDTGTTLTAVRACSFQENVAAMLPAARHVGIYPNFMPSPDFAYPMVATRDVGRVVAESLTSPPSKSEIVDVLGLLYSARDVAEVLSALLGKAVQVADIPPARHAEAIRETGFPERSAHTLAELNAAIGSGILVPRGTRSVTGTTTIDETLSAIVGAR